MKRNTKNEKSKKYDIAKTIIQKTIQRECDKARNIGIAAGAKTMATVILDIVNSDDSKSNKLKKIQNFCNTCMVRPVAKDLKARKEDSNAGEQM